MYQRRGQYDSKGYYGVWLTSRKGAQKREEIVGGDSNKDWSSCGHYKLR